MTSSGSTTIEGRLNSTPDKTFTLQFFSNPSNDNEGRRFIGQRSVSTNSNGELHFVPCPGDVGWSEDNRNCHRLWGQHL